MSERALPASLFAPLPADCWRQLFGADRPVAIEIGPGRGEFLLAAAARTPDWSFLGIEHSASRAAELEQRVAAAGLTNVRVLCGDAPCVLGLVPPESVAAVYVLFPDPWWKRRHHRRRLMTADFVATLRRALCPGGRLELVTDVGEYYERATATLAADGGFEPVASAPLDAGSPELQTTFARKAARQGATIHRGVFRRR